MNMEFKREMPTARVIKEMDPLTDAVIQQKKANDAEIKKVFTGESDKFLLIIGPCSADREDAVLDYMCRLRNAQEKVSDKIIIIPRIYTNKLTYAPSTGLAICLSICVAYGSADSFCSQFAIRAKW